MGSTPQRVHEQRKGGGVLATAGVIKMVAGEGGGPRLKKPYQPSVGDRLGDGILRDIGQPEAGFGGIYALRKAVKSDLAVNAYPHFSPLLLKLLGINAAEGR